MSTGCMVIAEIRERAVESYFGGTMVQREYLATFFVLLLSVSARATLPSCRIIAELAQQKGERTNLNHTRTDFFANKTHEGKPRFVMTMGLPGSGKSHWVSEARRQGWEVINLDSIRQEIAEKKRVRGEPITLRDGSTVLPDPNNMEHVFAMTKEAAQEGNRRFSAALASGTPVIWDGINNIPYFRSPLLYDARRMGYYTEALQFDSEDPTINLKNIAARAGRGGLDLVDPAKHSDPGAARRELIGKIGAQSREAPIREQRTGEATDEKKPADLRSSEGQSFIQGNDFVNHVERVRVTDWSSRPPIASSDTPLQRGVLSDSFRPAANKVKVAFFDADGTLRVTKSGKVTPNDPSDLVLLPGVAEKIKELNTKGYLVAIVSNQGGVPKYISMQGADKALQETVDLLKKEGATVHYFDFAESMDKEDPNRKPNVGMAERLTRRLKGKFGNDAEIDVEHSFMVGDAAYKKASKDEHAEKRPDGTDGFDFSNSDRVFAEKLGIKFHEPDAFFGWKNHGVRRFENVDAVNNASLATELEREKTIAALSHVGADKKVSHQAREAFEGAVKNGDFTHVGPLVSAINQFAKVHFAKLDAVNLQRFDQLMESLNSLLYISRFSADKSRLTEQQKAELAAKLEPTIDALIDIYPHASDAQKAHIARSFDLSASRSGMAHRGTKLLPHFVESAIHSSNVDLVRNALDALHGMIFNEDDVPQASLEAIRGALRSPDVKTRERAAEVLRNLLQRYEGGEGWKEKRLRSSRIADLFFEAALDNVVSVDRPLHIGGYTSYDGLLTALAPNTSNLPALVQPILQGKHQNHQVYATIADAIALNPKGASAIIPDLIRVLNDPRSAIPQGVHSNPKGEILAALAATGDARAISEVEKHLMGDGRDRLYGGRALLKLDPERFASVVAKAIPKNDIREYSSDEFLIKDLGELGTRAASAAPHLEKVALAQKSVSRAKMIIKVIEQIAGKEKARKAFAAYQSERRKVETVAERAPTGNRFFVPITEQELDAKIEAAWRRNSNFSPHGAIHWADLSASVRKDLAKVENEIENYEEVRLGTGKLANGLVYRAVRAGGDAEHPFYFIVYWDGKALRAYIPTEGNTWNTDAGRAYGHDEEADLANARRRFPHQVASEDDLDDIDGDEQAMLRDIGRRLALKK